MWLMLLLYLGLEGNYKARAHFSPGFKNIRCFGVILKKYSFNIFWQGRYSEY